MKKVFVVMALLFNVVVFADERTDLLEQEVQKLTNKVELLEHEVRLLKQHSLSNQATADVNVPDRESVPVSEANEISVAPKVPAAAKTSSEKEVYDLALGILKDKKYVLAREKFADFMSTYPKSNLLDRVTFWYAESYFGQKDFQNSALNYLKCYQKYPKGQKAQDSLLKLSMSLSELKRKTEVCKIIKKLEQEFPNRSANAKKIASDLKQKHSCK